MRIPDILGEGAKFLVGGALGWIGKVISDRNKKRRMRRNLYKELAQNYATIAEMTRYSFFLQRLQAGEISAFPLRREYFDHALRDMGTLFTIPEYPTLADIYDYIRTPESETGMDAFSRITSLEVIILDAVSTKPFSEQLFIEQSPKGTRAIVKEELRKRRSSHRV